MNSIITRFAPSPTGNLHIGSVRTALINYILTKQSKIKYPDSKFLLRIEDTDKKRSTLEYKENIIKNLNWLNINYEGKPFLQSSNISKHQEIAFDLIKKNKAFKCICSIKTLEKKRQENRKNKSNIKRLCNVCESDPAIQSLTKDFVVRIKVPLDGEITIKDLIQGQVTVKNKEIDDFILLRKDGTPTYMLSVVVDDYMMNVNLIIRGDDHLNNTFRQLYIYKNKEWPIPQFAHLPLIHGEDGKKLSKRHGAVDIQQFKDLGYLSQSIINNLILLGWSPGIKDEILEIEEILKLFKLENLTKSSSIFNYKKLNFFNNHFIKNDKAYKKLLDYCKDNIILREYINTDLNRFYRIFDIYKNKISFYKELENICINYFNVNFLIKKHKFLTSKFNILIKEFYNILNNIEKWNINSLEKEIKNFIIKKNIKFVLFGKPMRLLLINLENGPPISDILFILGKKNSIQRIKNYITNIQYE